MSILIRGMEMPKGNSTINVLIYADGTVYTGHVNDSRYSAVSVPTSHGRLGDLDELYKVANMADDFGADTTDILKLIIDTPAVIEAEGSET